MRTDVNACGATLGCMDTIRESALKVDSETKIPCRPGKPNLPQQHASPMLYQTELHPHPKLHTKYDFVTLKSCERLAALNMEWYYLS